MAEPSSPPPQRRRRWGRLGRLIRAILVVTGVVALVRFLNRLLAEEQPPATPTGAAPAAAPEPPRGGEPRHPEEVRGPDGLLTHPAVRREPTDISFRAILIGVLIAAGFSAVQFYLILYFFWWQLAAQRPYIETPYSRASGPSTELPAAPRIEQLDRLGNLETSNMHLRDQAREAVLHRFGPAGEPGFEHIPIEDAMRLAAKRLPVRKSPPPDGWKSRGLVDGGESNSGRMFRGEKPP